MSQTHMRASQSLVNRSLEEQKLFSCPGNGPTGWPSSPLLASLLCCYDSPVGFSRRSHKKEQELLKKDKCYLPLLIV